jgi:hypothetical protein
MPFRQLEKPAIIQLAGFSSILIFKSAEREASTEIKTPSDIQYVMCDLFLTHRNAHFLSNTD